VNPCEERDLTERRQPGLITEYSIPLGLITSLLSEGRLSLRCLRHLETARYHTQQADGGCEGGKNKQRARICGVHLAKRRFGRGSNHQKITIRPESSKLRAVRSHDLAISILRNLAYPKPQQATCLHQLSAPIWTWAVSTRTRHQISFS
jgi:hypothetical protein